MRELPLLACDSVALNLRSGRQTQHRVPMKHQPSPIDGWLWHAQRSPTPGLYLSAGTLFEALCRDHAPWQAGDVLYVRECWALPPQYDPLRHGDLKTEPLIGPVCHRAEWTAGLPWPRTHWRPSIHMPKWAARTWLHVRRVWVERVQDISDEDARAEGVGLVMADDLPEKERRELTNALRRSRRNGFRWMWERLYPGSWQRNDWLWCCELELDRERSGVTHG